MGTVVGVAGNKIGALSDAEQINTATEIGLHTMVGAACGAASGGREGMAAGALGAGAEFSWADWSKTFGIEAAKTAAVGAGFSLMAQTPPLLPVVHVLGYGALASGLRVLMQGEADFARKRFDLTDDFEHIMQNPAISEARKQAIWSQSQETLARLERQKAKSVWQVVKENPGFLGVGVGGVACVGMPATVRGARSSERSMLSMYEAHAARRLAPRPSMFSEDALVQRVFRETAQSAPTLTPGFKAHVAKYQGGFLDIPGAPKKPTVAPKTAGQPVQTLESDHYTHVTDAKRPIPEISSAKTVNAGAAFNRKMRALQRAQKQAVKTEKFSDGRIRYYETGRLSKKSAVTRDVPVIVTEYNPSTGQVHTWNESYNHAGKVTGGIAEEISAKFKSRGPAEQQLTEAGLLRPVPLSKSELAKVEQWETARNQYMKRQRELDVSNVSVETKRLLKNTTADNTIRNSMKSDDLAAILKEGRPGEEGVKMFGKVDGRSIDHAQELKDANKAISNVIVDIKARLERLESTGRVATDEAKLLQQKLSDLSKTKDLYTDLRRGLECQTERNTLKP